MTPEEAIGIVRCAIGEVEWNYPMDYSVAFETAIEALDLVNRQQAEIERLKIENQSLRGAANSYKLHYNEARAEAVKEFAERLKARIIEDFLKYNTDTTIGYIDNLVKEMAGDTE